LFILTAQARRLRLIGDTAEVKPTSLPDVKEMFLNNVGKTSQVFDNSHPFIREVGTTVRDQIKSVADKATLGFERNFIRKSLKENVQSKISPLLNIEDKSIQVKFNKDSIGKSMSQEIDGIDNKLAQIRAMLSIEQLLKEAIYLGSDGERKGRDIKAWHYFRVTHQGKNYTAVVKETEGEYFTFYTLTNTDK
jgi:hypothetical protein